MTITIEWRIVKPKSWRSLPGTSNDWTTFNAVFGHRYLTAADVTLLSAMHLSTRLSESLWGSLAEVLNNLPEDSEIEVRGEY